MNTSEQHHGYVLLRWPWPQPWPQPPHRPWPQPWPQFWPQTLTPTPTMTPALTTTLTKTPTLTPTLIPHLTPTLTPNPNPDSNTHANPDPNHDPNPNPDPNPKPNPIPNPNPDPNPKPNPIPDPNPNPIPDSNPDLDPKPDPDPNPDPNRTIELFLVSPWPRSLTFKIFSCLLALLLLTWLCRRMMPLRTRLNVLRARYARTCFWIVMALRCRIKPTYRLRANMPRMCAWNREREMFCLTTHSTHFIYGYMASDIWLRTILIVRKETRCRHMGYYIPKQFLNKGRKKEMFYLTMHSIHFIYGYMASDIWLRTILIVRKETRCHHIGYSYRLTTRHHPTDRITQPLLHQSWSTGWNEI